MTQTNIDYPRLIAAMKGQTVDRPNKADAGTLSGHAAGEPFEKAVYHELKNLYPTHIFKHYEFLNDLYLSHPKHITVEQKHHLIDSPTALFLISRRDKATEQWSPTNMFEEKQDDTADIIYFENGFYDLLDVKTRNRSKNAQAPNIISAYKLAQMCTYMIDNNDYDTVGLNYIEIDWVEEGSYLRCTNAHHGDLFRANPRDLYINWAAGLQVQFHVCDLDQTWDKPLKEWCVEYLRVFVESAKKRCEYMNKTFIEPFLKYIE